MKVYQLLFVVVCIAVSVMSEPTNIIRQDVQNTGVFQQGCEIDIGGVVSRKNCENSPPGNYRSQNVQNTGVFKQG
ncbi:hypothetical protein FF38_13611 [Lucilia cuprina]|uniref:Uncharacterized protein n=1 Tax=Lucilia cuprina TaxID=7375 RepID=A0A0L0CA82_LUCCU|nr:hypothetical protein CVS40_12305 [Lucilia cuprina]KNC29156.1 hypothetical protein FF38_13611 [Lucilia cuprina]